jgi:hypothetical protein
MFVPSSWKLDRQVDDAMRRFDASREQHAARRSGQADIKFTDGGPTTTRRVAGTTVALPAGGQYFAGRAIGTPPGPTTVTLHDRTDGPLVDHAFGDRASADRFIKAFNRRTNW